MTLIKMAEHQKIRQFSSVNMRPLYKNVTQPGPITLCKMRNNEGNREGKQNKAN